MLLVGTTRHLEDLDRQFSLAEDVVVTAIAPAGPHALGGEAFVIIDGERIARIEEYELAPLSQLSAGDGQSMAVADGVLLVGLADAHIVTVDARDGTLTPIEAFDSVAGRESWENPAGPSPEVRSIAVTPAGSWFVSVHVGGVWRSADAGRTWSNVVPPEADVHEVVSGSDGTVAVAAAGGFGWSSDDGQAWQWSTDGLAEVYCRAVALDGDVVYLSASSGPSADDGRLYTGHLGGSVQQCLGGLPDSFPFNIDTGTVTAADGKVAVGLPSGEIWRSTDAGASFRRVTERVGHVRVLRFT